MTQETKPVPETKSVLYICVALGEGYDGLDRGRAVTVRIYAPSVSETGPASSSTFGPDLSSAGSGDKTNSNARCVAVSSTVADVSTPWPDNILSVAQAQKPSLRGV